MPAYGVPKKQPKQLHAFRRSVICLMFFAVSGSTTSAGTLVNPDPAMAASEATSISEINGDSSVTHANPARLPEFTPHATLPEDTVTWTARRTLREVGKQAIDQPGHFLIGAAPIWASRYLVGVPWFGWVVAPILAYREWLQWPSKRWWDPLLDWTFLTFGAVAATWSRRPAHGLAGAFAAIRPSVASGLALPSMR